MASVSVNPPRTPVTKGSNGIAVATLPNVCKMPGPPPPFVPTPLPNIGKSGDSPKGYSKKVKVEGQTVAIKGASFGSMGDAASKGTGGGIVSVNTHGPAKFIGPGSFDVKIEGKNVQYLGDPMLNNCGPSGNPTNAATLAGVIQAPQDLIDEVGKERAEEICKSVCKNFQPGGARGPGVTRDFSKDDWPLFSAKEPFDILSEVTQVMPGSLNNNTKEFSPIMSRTGRCVGGPGGPPGAPLAHGSVVRSMGVTSRSKGSTVRWDLTVLKNAAETPTQDNISAWVEVKGDKEKLTVNQRKAKAMLKQIKGDKPKLIVVTPKKCGCPEKKSKGA